MKRYILFIVLACFFASCSESILDLKPISSASTVGFYKSNQDFLNAINGAYNSLQSGAYGANEFMFGDLPTDDAYAVGALGAQGHQNFNQYTSTPTSSNSGQVNNRWVNSYTGIMRCNAILGRIDAITTLDATLKARYIAEAKFLRGVFYFQLVKVFGAVPLVLAEITDISKAYDFGRNPVAEIFVQIQKDLTEAAAGLPATYTVAADKGRATSGAANGMLARVLIWQKKFTEASPILLGIINSGPYSLLPNYADVFKAANGNNAEILFAIQYTDAGIAPGQNNGSITSFHPTGGTLALLGYYGTNADQPTPDLFNAYQTTDLRRDINIGSMVITGISTYFVNKYITPTIVSIASDGTDIPVLRFADVILMYAECLNEAGDIAGAITQVNKVRARAFNGATQNLQSTDAANVVTYVAPADKAGMSNMIMRERRLELAYEGLRFFDLVRTDRLLTTMNAYYIKYQFPTPTTIIVLSNNNKLWPVPQVQIDLNPTKITQNPGY